MRNLMQEQLLKAGLVDKNKAKAISREQARDKKQNARQAVVDDSKLEAQRLLAERAERDRQLAAEQKSKLHIQELQAQIRQIIEHYKQKRDGDIAYSFSDSGKVKNLYVNERLRAQLSKGHLVIVRHGNGYELVPRVAAEKIRERDDRCIILDHGVAASDAAEDDPYKDFPVPDDLIW